ncbi:MAG TPA: glutathione S-transferase family protein [Alphaproteobacteria bacterium]
MIDLYMFATPNCWRAAITLEELGVKYAVKWIDLMNRGNTAPEYLKKNPVAKVPLIEDSETGAQVYGSLAIQLYLADRAGKLLPKSPKERGEALDWLMFVGTDLCNAMSNVTRFKLFVKPTNEEALKIFNDDVDRFLKVADERLHGRDWFCGDFSVVDIAAAAYLAGPRNVDAMLAKFPNVKRWSDKAKARPAVQRGLITKAPEARAA